MLKPLLNLTYSRTYSNNSKIFRYLQDLTHSNVFPSCMSHNSSMATSDEGKACLLNQYFYSIFTQSDFILPPLSNIPTPQDCLNVIHIEEKDVYSALSCLDSNKAMGIDNIGPMLLKTCAIALTTPLYHLFVLTLTQHSLPKEWGIHHIIPIFKSGDKSLAKNYPPISLLCTVSKVLEHIIYDKMIDFVCKKISPAQFGFVPTCSTVQQLPIMLDSIFKAYETSN